MIVFGFQAKVARNSHLLRYICQKHPLLAPLGWRPGRGGGCVGFPSETPAAPVRRGEPAAPGGRYLRVPLRPKPMPATAPGPKKKAAPATNGAAKKPADKPPVRKSNIIPNLLKGKLVAAPDFFEPHERPANWPSGL